MAHSSFGSEALDVPASTAIVVSCGASYLFIQSIITSAAQTVSFAILARIITPKEVGILAVLSLVTALSLALVGSAFQQTSSKFIGELSDKSEMASAIFYQITRIAQLSPCPWLPSFSLVLASSRQHYLEMLHTHICSMFWLLIF